MHAYAASCCFTMREINSRVSILTHDIESYRQAYVLTRFVVTLRDYLAIFLLAF